MTAMCKPMACCSRSPISGGHPARGLRFRYDCSYRNSNRPGCRRPDSGMAGACRSSVVFDGPRSSLTGCPSLHCYPGFMRWSVVDTPQAGICSNRTHRSPGGGAQVRSLFQRHLVVLYPARVARRDKLSLSGCLCCACLLELTSERAISSNIPECRSARSPKFPLCRVEGGSGSPGAAGQAGPTPVTPYPRQHGQQSRSGQS